MKGSFKRIISLSKNKDRFKISKRKTFKRNLKRNRKETKIGLWTKNEIILTRGLRTSNISLIDIVMLY
jgi:hypothetical protein